MARQKSQNKRAKIPRKSVDFKLRTDHPEDQFVMEILAGWRTKRKGLTNFRKAVQVLYALELFENGGDEEALKFLFELFPSLRRHLVPDNSALIEEFRQMLQAQTVTSPMPASAPALPSGSRPIAAAQSIPMPIFDDDNQDTVIIRRDTTSGANSAANFLNAAFALTGKAALSLDDDDDQPPDLPTGSLKLKPLG